MAFEKLGAWFLTKSGQQFSYIFTGATTIGVMLTTSLPHTLLIEPYKDFLHLYKNGITVSLSDKLKARFKKAIDLAEIQEDDKHLFQPFAAYGFDIVSAGTSYSRFGVIVGIPANFAYEDASDIDKSKIKINLESVHWELPEAKSFLNSLILSEKAQLYAMAREIKMRDSAKVILDTFYATTACLGTYGISNYFNKSLNLYARPLPLRLILYTLTVAFMGGNYFLAKDATQVFYEQTTDEKLKKASPLLAEGGKEFYRKILQRNIALRRLMGKEGESIYTALGNENYLLRNKHIPLVDRKLFFEKDDATTNAEEAGDAVPNPA